MNEPVRRRTLAPVCAALALACSGPPAVDLVEIRDARIEIEIADDQDAQALGLGERETLPWNRGMLLVYEEPTRVAIWMKGMRFDIDIVWIRDGRIIDMTWRAPHATPEPLPVYYPREAADRGGATPREQAHIAALDAWCDGDPATTLATANT